MQTCCNDCPLMTESLVHHTVLYKMSCPLSLQKLQDELSEHLCQLSDLAVECDQLAEQESPQEAERLRLQLAALQRDMTQFKLDSTQKQDHLKDALKESERKKKELDEYRESVENLQKWIGDTKKISEAPVAVEATIKLTEEKKLLQQVFATSVHHGLTAVPVKCF